MNERNLPGRFLQFGFTWGLCIGLLFYRIQDSNSQELPFLNDVLTFSQYSYAEGLPFNPETVIFQDRAGYMWFGSSQGLCRYNGYSFEYFGGDPQKSNSLSNPDTSSVYEDEQERLWIGTGNGLNCLDKWRERCKQYFHDPHNERSLSGNRITCLSGGQNRALWVGTTEGLNRIDLETNACTRYLHAPQSPDEPLCKVISALYADSDGRVWVGSNENLFRFDARSAQFSRVDINEKNTIERSLITCILKSRSGKLWIGRYKSGSACLDPGALQVIHYKCKLDDPHEVHRSLYEDESGILWIATGTGLLRLNPQTGAWARETYRSERLNCLSSGGVLKVGGERSGAVWVATDNKLNRYDPSRFPFRMIKHNPNDSNSMSANSVFSICEDAKGMIWIGLEDQGLNRYDPKTQTFKQYINDPDDPTSLSYNTVTALCPDPSGKIWVGTHLRGVCLFDPQTERFKRFPWNKDARDPVDGTGLNNDIVRAILVARDGKVWIGAENGGLNLYDPRTKRFSYFQYDPTREDSLCSNDVRSILEDRNGTIWAANLDFGSAGGAGRTSRGGLNRFLPETQSFKRYPCAITPTDRLRQLSGHRVYDLLEDRQGRFWLGADSGIVEFDRERETFYYYSTQAVLRGNDFQSLVESDDGYLWISTGYSGIVRLNLETKEIAQYDISDGMEDLGFRINAGIKTRDGSIYFGCSSGLSVLDGGRIRTNSYVPPTRIQRIQVLDNDVPLSHFGDALSIRLPYWKNVLAFEFAALNFTRSLQNRYAYRLQGLDKDWVESGDRRFARYSKIPPGNYVFRVQGRNNDGVWNETGESIRIVIDPPFWMTWWFRLTAALAIVFCIGGGVFLQSRHVRADNRRLEKEVRDRTAKIRADRDYLLHIIHTSPVVILGFLEDGTLTFINPAGEKTFCISSNELLGKNWWNIASNGSEREQIESIHRRIANNEFYEREIPLTLPSGRIRTILWSFVDRYDENGRRAEILAFANDITERLENEILKVSGREQRKIGQEIHDSICQTLTGLTFMCSGLLNQKETLPPSHEEMIAKIKDHLYNVTAQSKQLARGLYLHELENRGLAPALKELTTTIQNLFNVRCDFHSEGIVAIDNFEICTHLYRIAQEALSNAVKHSQANRIDLTINADPQKIFLSVRDNGAGFDFQDDSFQRGMGLGIMINRARMISASLTIDAQPGKGTDVRCLLKTNV